MKNITEVASRWSVSHHIEYSNNEGKLGALNESNLADRQAVWQTNCKRNLNDVFIMVSNTPSLIISSNELKTKKICHLSTGQPA